MYYVLEEKRARKSITIKNPTCVEQVNIIFYSDIPWTSCYIAY